MKQTNGLGVSQIFTGLALGGVIPPSPWLCDWVEHSKSLFSSMQPLQQCNFIWAVATWDHQPPEHVLQAFATACCSQFKLYNATDLMTVLWSLGQLTYVPDESFMDAWLTASLAALPRYSPSHFATTALVLGRWGVVPKREYMVSFFHTSSTR